MTATETITCKKLKIRIGSIIIGADSGTKPCQLSQQLVVGSECCQSVSAGTCNKSEMVKSHNSVIPSLDTSKHGKFSSMDSNKRGLSEVGEVQKEKRRKMDRIVTQQCAILLKQLMFHPAGWVFNQPVDPVKLQIPDYYDIISEPMDLGTIKRKLNNNEYSSVDEFTAHVRLTFSNAMRYNPPDNSVHLMAKELNDLFNLKSNALETKWSCRHKKVQQGQNISGIVKHTDNSCKNGIDVRTLPKGPVSAVEKQELRKQLLGLLRGKVPSHLQGFLSKSGFNLQRLEKIEEVMDAISDEDLWKLRKTISSCLIRTAKVAPTKEPDHISQNSGTKIIHKGSDNGTGSATGSANVVQPPNSVTSECSSCRRMRCQCNTRSDVTHEPSGHSSCPSVTTKDTATTSPEGWALLVDVPLSPQKALRAAMLKSRFADTILKAKLKALQDHEDKADPVKFKQEKERLKRQQQAERARIETQIRASKEAARLRAEAERKLQCEREREAARLALQQMVKTVEINNDHTVVKDLVLLRGCSPSDLFSCSSCGSNPEVDSSESGHSFRVLEQLGLFMKDDYMEYEDEDETVLSGRGDAEDGELFP